MKDIEVGAIPTGDKMKINNTNEIEESNAEDKSSAKNAHDSVETHVASIKEAMIGDNESIESVTSTTATIAIVQALKEANDKGGSDMVGHKDPNLPLTLGRLAFEAVYNQHKQPWAWDHLKPVGHTGKYVNPVTWLGTVKPSDWDQKKQKEDEHGKPVFDKNGKAEEEWVNEDRKSYPNAVFLTSRRIQQYKDLVLASAEPMYIALWAIKIDCERWTAAEPLISLDPYWWSAYEAEFGPSLKGVNDAIQDMGRDFGSPSAGKASG